METMIERATKTAHLAVSAIHPFALTFDGATHDAVLLDSWEGTSEMMPGYRKGAETATASILKFGTSQRPREGARIETSDGRKGEITAVSTGAAHYVLTIIAYKP